MYACCPFSQLAARRMIRHLAVNKKPSRWENGRVSQIVSSLSANDVCRLEAFGALQQIKLHGLSFVECAVTVLLDGGEVHEYIFPRGALDKSISLRPVEPLHCSFLSHGKNSFHFSRRIILRCPRSCPGPTPEAPLKETGRTLGCACLRSRSEPHSVPKEKAPSSSADLGKARRERFGAPEIELFYHFNSTST